MSRQRSNLPFIGGLLVVALAVPLSWFLFLREAPPLEAPLPVAPIAPKLDAGSPLVELKLTELTGTVEVRAGSGDWKSASKGAVLKPSDRVRTLDGSYAVLVGGELIEVKMEPGTEVQVGELSESISRVLLESGMAHARVKGGRRHTFEVRTSKSDAVASTDGGMFTISSNGQGTVAVGADEGALEFRGQGRVVIVRAGQQSLVRPGQGPTEPVTVPTTLLLKVAMPARTTVNRPKLMVVGTVEPGSSVEVDGHVVIADANGRFEFPVQLKEGGNEVSVRAKSVGQLETISKHVIELDTTVKKPTIDPDLWGAPAREER